MERRVRQQHGRVQDGEVPGREVLAEELFAAGCRELHIDGAEHVVERVFGADDPVVGLAGDTDVLEYVLGNVRRAEADLCELVLEKPAQRLVRGVAVGAGVERGKQWAELGIQRVFRAQVVPRLLRRGHGDPPTREPRLRQSAARQQLIADVIASVATRPPRAYLGNMVDSIGLADLRRRLELSQEQMAQLLGVSFASVNRWEGGHSYPTRSVADLYEAIRAALKAGHPGSSIVRAANNERGRFLYELFRMAYEPPTEKE